VRLVGEGCSWGQPGGIRSGMARDDAVIGMRVEGMTRW